MPNSWLTPMHCLCHDRAGSDGGRRQISLAWEAAWIPTQKGSGEPLKWTKTGADQSTASESPVTPTNRSMTGANGSRPSSVTEM